MHTFPTVGRAVVAPPPAQATAEWCQPSTLEQVGRLVSANSPHARGTRNVRPLYMDGDCARYRVSYRQLCRNPKYSEPQSHVVADYWVKVRLGREAPVLEELRQDLPRKNRPCKL